MKIHELDIAIKRTIQAVKLQGIKTFAGNWQGIRDFEKEEMLVLYNWFISDIEIPGTIEELQNQTKCDLPWAEDHFQERISRVPSNPGETYKYWPYNTFKETGDPYKPQEVFSHTYQERFWPKKAGQGIFPPCGIRYDFGDLDDVIDQIIHNPLTRQAYLPIFYPEDTGARDRRVPCTLGYYFYLTGNKLNINYTIRSCDVFRHFRNDMYLTGRLLQYVAKRTYSEVGVMSFMGYNVHLFLSNSYALDKREKQIEYDRKL